MVNIFLFLLLFLSFGLNFVFEIIRNLNTVSFKKILILVDLEIHFLDLIS